MQKRKREKINFIQILFLTSYKLIFISVSFNFSNILRGPDTIIFSFRRSLLRSLPNIFTKNTPRIFFYVRPSVTHSQSSCLSCLSVCLSQAT